MSLPEPLRQDRVARLAATLTEPPAGEGPRRPADEGPRPPDAPPQAAPAAPAVRSGRARAKRLVRRAISVAARPIIERAAAPGRQTGEQALREVAQLDRSVSSLQATALASELERNEAAKARSQLDAVSINLELLKGEVRAIEAQLERLGVAIASSAGLSGVADAMAELRERVSGVERSFRSLGRSSTGPPSASPDRAGPPPNHDSPVSALFDYTGFERRFRGKPADVLATLDERYGALLMANAPVVDLGCGRAELVELLTERGLDAIGVDTDPSMVADAQQRGLNVVSADAVGFLRQQAPGTLGAIIATHLLEHLALDPLIELLELSATRLRPGGVFIAETPNPTSLIVLGNSYILDPTHVRPLHPKLLEFLCDRAGFRTVELRFFAPATGYHLETITDPEAPVWVEQINRALAHLNEVLFGAQDYAVVGTTARG